VTSIITAGTTHTQLTLSDYDELRKSQANAARLWLHTSNICSQWAILAELCWTPVDAHIWYSKACLIESIKRLPDKEDSKHVLKARIPHVEKGHTLGLLYEASTIWSKTDSPLQWKDLEPWSKANLKRTLARQLIESAWDQAWNWIENHPEKVGPYLEVTTGDSRCAPAWHLQAGTRRQQGLMSTARMGSWWTRKHKHEDARSGGNSCNCTFCDKKEEETSQHVILQCSWELIKPIRNEALAEIKVSMTPEQRIQWNLSTPREKWLIILGKKMNGLDSLKNRLSRDRTIKVMMEKMDDLRIWAGEPPLTGNTPPPASFSMGEAHLWSLDAAQDHKSRMQHYQ
jgi:hypothetical protein